MSSGEAAIIAICVIRIVGVLGGYIAYIAVK